MTELETLLEQGAGDDPVTFDADVIGHRVRRRRTRRRAASGFASLVLVVSVAAAVIMVVDRADEQQVATEPTTAEPAPGEREGEEGPAESIDVRAELSRGGWVAVEHSDWTRPTEGLGHNGQTSVWLHEGGQAQGQLLCNTFGARWRVDDTQLVIDEMIQSVMGCDPHEDRVAQLLTGRPTIEWSEERPDELRLRDGDRYIDFERIDPWFMVLDMREASAPIGSLAVAASRDELDELYGLNVRLSEGEELFGPRSRSVDFDQSVVVSIVIPDNACPPSLERFERDGSVLTPVFVQPPGACIDPLVPKVFVIAIDRADVTPGFTFRYPADDAELQHRPPLGPYDGEIWVDVEAR